MRIALAHPRNATLRALQALLTKEPGQRLCWCTDNGNDAILRAAQEPVELLLLDIGFTRPTSVEITGAIRAANSCAVLLLADRPHAHVGAIYEAMGLGAIDVVRSPELPAAGDADDCEPLHTKLRALGKLLGRSGGRRAPSGRPSAALCSVQPPLVALGASTGGPQALFRVLSELQDAGAAVVIAQHVDSEFSQGLADWLQQGTSLRVELATQGCVPQAGTALLAGSNDHLILTAQGHFIYSKEPRQLPYRPSVDVLFRSLAEHWPRPAVAALLTGMGRDGAQGLKQLREAGWQTIAQDESSCVVFGMPKAAIELGAADRVLPLDAIGRAIAQACGSQGQARARVPTKA